MTRKQYDVVVVGAGLAGLAAACELRDLDVLVIEKDDRTGGRVLTGEQHGAAYELGAVFACDHTALPCDLDGVDLLSEDEPIGLFHDGKVYYGNTVDECISGIGISNAEKQGIKDFRAGQAQDLNLLSETAYTVLNAFFQTLHPGEMKDYLPCRRLDAFRKFVVVHFAMGNGEVIKALRNQPGAGTMDLVLNAEVVAVEEQQNNVRVTFGRESKEESALARASVVTAPAPDALRMLGESSAAAPFLSSLQYGECTVVALGLADVQLSDFSYIVACNLPANTILAMDTNVEGVQALLVYYVGRKSELLAGLEDEEIIRKTMAVVDKLRIGEIEERNLLFSEVYQWPIMGPIISEPVYGKWNERSARPGERVFLAGEHVHVNPADAFPYGTLPAIMSGRRTAFSIRALLDAESHSFEIGGIVPRDPIAEGFRKTSLMAGRIGVQAAHEPTPMLCKPPPPTRPFFYGDLVPLGLLSRALNVTQDQQLARVGRELIAKLLQGRQSNLWSFHSGRLATSTDSALVLLGVTGQDAVAALGAVEAFADGHGFYYPQLWSENREQGRMRITPGNRHWCQPDYATTCLVRALRKENGLEEVTGLNCLADGFDTRSGLFIANPYMVDWMVALALAKNESAEPLRRRLLAEVLASMNDDHSFGNYDVAFSTALAILCMSALGYRGEKIPACRLRLLKFMNSDGSWPKCTPFYSSSRIDESRAASLQANALWSGRDPQLAHVEGQNHEVTLYLDEYRIIATAVAALALSEECDCADPATCEEPEPTDVHPRYKCQHHVGYIARFALPPYLPH